MRLFKSAILTLILSLAVPALAQSRLFGEALAANFTLAPNFALDASVSAGATQVLGPLDARVSLDIWTLGGTTQVALGADVLYPLPVALNPGRLDVGLGLQGLFVSSSSDFALRGLLGYELPLQSGLAVRVEPNLVYSFTTQQATFGLSLGPRVYLR